MLRRRLARPPLGLAALCAATTLGFLGIAASGASGASAVRVCVPRAEGRAIVTPVKGACRAGASLATLSLASRQVREGKAGVDGSAGLEGKPGPEGRVGPEGKQGPEGPPGPSPFSSAETAALKAVLPYISLIASGVGGKPTIRFTGANVQIVNGEGVTESVNGAGNLIVGYDAEAGAQSGSHNLVLGAHQTYTSYGDLIAGVANHALSYFSAIFGAENTVSGPSSSVTGGYRNSAGSTAASVSGGEGNLAEGSWSAVGGGSEGTAGGNYASVTGGFHNSATGEYAAVGGGALGSASGSDASLSGGLQNTASGSYSAILGGKQIAVNDEFGVSP